MKYSLKDIIIFTHVAKLKSFAKTAKVLNLSLSVVSTRISDLEKSLKMNLLARTTRQVNLTAEGHTFLNYCNHIVEKCDNLDNFLQNSNGIYGTLRIVLPPYFSRYHIVPYLEEFLKLYPNLKLDIFPTEEVVDIIAEGYDLQVRIQIPTEETLETAKLMTNEKAVFATDEYIAQHGKPSKPQDLINHNCLIFGENSVWKFKHKQSGEIIEMKNLNSNIKCDNGELIKELTMAGIGITLKSSRDTADEVKSGKLIMLLEDYEVMHKTQFYVVYPFGKYTSPKIKAFIDFFQNKLKQP